MYYLVKVLFSHPGHYIAAMIISIGTGAFRYFALPEEVSSRYAWYEMLSVSGFVTFLVGLLLTVAYMGAFDLFGYAFNPGRRSEIKKYKDYADYSQQMAEKRARGGYYFVPYYVVGIVVFLISNFLL